MLIKKAAEIAANVPKGNWEKYDICPKCGSGKQKPCYDLRSSKPGNLVEANNPHQGRKKLKLKDR